LNTTVVNALITRMVIAASMLVSAVSHAYLFGHGYGHVPTIGPAFLVQASVFFAIGVLVILGGPDWLIAASGVLAIGALGAFTLSRTVGLAGFVERGWDPAPHALVSVLAEAVTVLACSAWVLNRRRTSAAGH
jgi:hypothetical protein